MEIKSTKFKKLLGFTLVELTVSMGVLALIISVTAGVLITVVRSYQKQRAVAEVERNGDFIMRNVEESFRGAQAVRCVDFSGTDLTPTLVNGKCDLGAGRLIEVQGVTSKYFGLGSDSTSGTANCNKTDPTNNCFVYIVNAVGSGGDIVGQNLKTPDTNYRLTNSAGNGSDVHDFSAIISGGGTSSAPSNITVTIEVRGSKTGLYPNEARTFQSFLTARGSYF